MEVLQPGTRSSAVVRNGALAAGRSDALLSAAGAVRVRRARGTRHARTSG
jgi:hypothetical protein